MDCFAMYQPTNPPHICPCTLPFITTDFDPDEFTKHSILVYDSADGSVQNCSTPLLTHWSYCRLALSHAYHIRHKHFIVYYSASTLIAVNGLYFGDICCGHGSPLTQSPSWWDQDTNGVAGEVDSMLINLFDKRLVMEKWLKIRSMISQSKSLSWNWSKSLPKPKV